MVTTNDWARTLPTLLRREHLQWAETALPACHAQCEWLFWSDQDKPVEMMAANCAGMTQGRTCRCIRVATFTCYAEGHIRENEMSHLNTPWRMPMAARQPMMRITRMRTMWLMMAAAHLPLTSHLLVLPTLDTITVADIFIVHREHLPLTSHLPALLTLDITTTADTATVDRGQL